MDGNREYSYNGDSPSQGEDGASTLMSVEELHHLVQLLDQSDVSEIELKRVEEGTRLVLRKIKGAESGSHEQSLLTMPLPDVKEAAQTRHTITASLVGIFHPWAKPKGGTLVAVGERVKTGQLVATIQSLNVMNEVEAPRAGRVVEILVQDGQAVEYGQPLLIIDSDERA